MGDPIYYLSPRTKVLNIFVPFDEGLKLNLAIDESLRKLNKYKRSTTEGKRAAVNVSIHLETSRITVNEGKLKNNPPKKNNAEGSGFHSSQKHRREGRRPQEVAEKM